VRRPQISIPPLNTFEDTRKALQAALNSLAVNLVQGVNAPIDGNGGIAGNFADPKAPQDLATKGYVDTQILQIPKSPITSGGTGGSSIAGGSVTVLAQSGTLTAQNLQINSAIAPAGVYMVSMYITTATVGSGAAAGTVSWTDTIGAKSFTLIPAFNLTSGTFGQGTFVLQTAGGVNITFAVIATTTGTYNVYTTLTRLI
jgi:hypothetical protein